MFAVLILIVVVVVVVAVVVVVVVVVVNTNVPDGTYQCPLKSQFLSSDDVESMVRSIIRLTPF